MFAIGALVLGWFVLGLVTGHSYDKTGYVGEGEWKVRQEELEMASR
jgi:nitric oxide reductase subunit B